MRRQFTRCAQSSRPTYIIYDNGHKQKPGYLYPMDDNGSRASIAERMIPTVTDEQSETRAYWPLLCESRSRGFGFDCFAPVYARRYIYKLYALCAEIEWRQNRGRTFANADCVHGELFVLVVVGVLILLI